MPFKILEITNNDFQKREIRRTIQNHSFQYDDIT